MNLKKVAFLASAALMVSFLAGCKSNSGTVNADLTYWCPSVDNEVMETLVERFKASKEEYADLVIQRAANWGEGETSSQLVKDINKAADVMLMADDNIRASVASEGLAELDASDVTKFTTEAGKAAVDACSIDGTLYGFPYRADNSPMPFYDKTMFTGEDANKINSLEGMLEVAEKNNAKVYLDMGNGWYNAFLLWTNGGDFGINKEDNGKLSIATNFGDQSAETKATRGKIAKVLEATKALYNRYKDVWVSSSENSLVEAGFKGDDANNKIAVAFLWNDITAIRAANNNVAVAKWPTLKVEEKDLQLHCFQSYKAIVCKNGIDEERVELAKEFGRFLAGEDAQKLRADLLQYGPADLSVAASYDASKLPFSTAIREMQAANLTHSQAIRTTGDFWTPMQTLGELVINKSTGWGTLGDADTALRSLCPDGQPVWQPHH